jgi:hypothetical protein
MEQIENSGEASHAFWWKNVSIRVLVAAVFATLAITRIPLAPKYLYYFDSVNFALALDEFNPGKHQPQPPGYPMFVALMRLVHFAVPRAEDVLVVSGLLAATAATVLLWRLADEMFGRRAAMLAVALFLFNPALWLGGITNQVRTALALCSTGVALLAWRALQRPMRDVAVNATFAAAGLGAGFRPALGILLIPLLLFVWWRESRSIGRLVGYALIGALSTTPWVTAAVIAVGGLREWFTLMWQYSDQQFSGTSLLFGASVKSSWNMLAQAVVWNGLGALAWIWAVPFVRARWSENATQKHWWFLTVWFAPIFLFAAFVHIGDPDQALASIPVLCIVGGRTLDLWLQQAGNSRVVATAAVAACANAALFFYPPGRLAAAASYKAVRSVDRQTQDVFAAIRHLKANSPVSIVEYHGVITWRHLSYYFPNDPVLYLAANPSEFSWILLHRSPVETKQPPVFLPGPRRVILISTLEKRSEMLAQGWKQYGPAYYRDVRPSEQVVIGPYRLTQPEFL